MPAPLTEAQRGALVEHAIDAVRALLAAETTTGPSARERRPGVREVAELAVTDAVVRADVPYRHIADLAGCASLQIATLITDEHARGRALGSEREAARAHSQRVRDACRAHAGPIVHDGDHGAISAAARDLGMTRKALYELANPPGRT